jgi:hypothetical protein
MSVYKLINCDRESIRAYENVIRAVLLYLFESRVCLCIRFQYNIYILYTIPMILRFIIHDFDKDILFNSIVENI